MRLYDRSLRKYRTIQVDPEGFYPPDYIHSDTDLELWQDKYSKLHNMSKTLLSVRCNNKIYGGADRTV